MASVQLPKKAMRLRIYLGEADRHGREPLYEAIVKRARAQHLAGATVLRGPMGYGQSSRLHTAKILRLSSDLPIVIEIIDTAEKINAFLVKLDQMHITGLITLDPVTVLRYGRAQVEAEE